MSAYRYSRFTHNFLNFFWEYAYCSFPVSASTSAYLALSLHLCPSISTPPSLPLLSYAFIVVTILKIPSAEGRHKAFSTCASHLTVVVVHYGFASVIYLKPKGPKSLEGDTLMGITYTVLTPFLSPIIFSLRNKELKNAMKKIFLSKLYPEKI